MVGFGGDTDPEDSMTVTELEREVRALKIYSALSTIVVIVVCVATQMSAQAKKPRFAELDVERLNIVEADGRLALVLANTHRLPGPMIAGKELAKELSAGRIGSAGMLFVDAQGNEVGGLTYSAAIKDRGAYSAEAGFTFDQHNQDQVVGIEYFDDGAARGYGLSVWDRPTKVSIAEMLDAAKGIQDREARHARFAELLKARGDRGGARRVFLGSQDRTAALRLADAEGRERIRLYVDATNHPRLEFLDETGRVTYAMPGPER
jgi:hypothetical protein